MLGELTAHLALAGSVPRGVREGHIDMGGGKRKRKKRKGRSGLSLSKKNY